MGFITGFIPMVQEHPMVFTIEVFYKRLIQVQVRFMEFTRTYLVELIILGISMDYILEIMVQLLLTEYGIYDIRRIEIISKEMLALEPLLQRNNFMLQGMQN